ncbi:SRPBCC family protein [Nodosilinea sp. LEGE 07088]|uniref:SRPBCC family protein n=1 Tax=Nodosilinea sp. LEGE 07088 TaxID=2777968 RepID=UPI001881F571|nr:SRPBCC family protein [Nodosilinea sp. LEGE 07088]MBE9140975.1 SRPBCC family protein [Nodosilinea sp. LEGE 07088]
MGEWLDHSVVVDVDVPIETAWDLWSDLEQMPRWMKWIDGVTISADDPEISEWKLASRGFEFTWRSKITSLVPHQIIQWEAIDGLPNRGAIRFYGKDDRSTVKLTVSYAVPAIIKWMDGLFLGRLVEATLQDDLNRFRDYAVAAKQPPTA